jgi:endonuclease/exonuclease/phosphatase family metal-dependent hydrolase
VSEFSVLTLNLRFGLADDGPNGWEHRKESIVRFFQEHDPDFIATQEANDFQVDFLADSLAGYEHIGRRLPSPWFWQDNILFYRKSIVCEEQDRFFLSETPRVPSRSYGSRFPRQGTLGLFNIGGRSLICVDTHFDFDTPAQMGAARVIKEQLVSFPHDTPAILMGDFNATPESPCYRWLTGNKNGGERGLCFEETFAEPYPSTFHGFSGKPMGGHIDWVLYRGPLRLKACRVLKESVADIYLSDHYPVEAVFEL